MTENMHDRNTGPMAAHDEQSLGAALGRAIGARVDAGEPATRPPLTTIADRAAARARVRATRRTVVAVAASVLVAVGVVAGWRTLYRQDTATVLVTAEGALERGPGTLPAAGSDDPQAPATPAEPRPDTVPAAGSNDPQAPATPAEPRPGTVPAAGSNDPQAPATPAPEDLSTGPVLQWAEVDPGFVDLVPFQSTGDGRVIAYAWSEGAERVLHRERLVVTSNGTDWEELRLPEGLIPEEINIGGDRWLVVGRYRNFAAPEDRLDLVFFSDDRGSSWTKLEFETPPDAALALPYLNEHLWVSPALVRGEQMVLVLQGYTSVDADSLLADLGLLPEGKEVLSWRDATPGTVVFVLHSPFETDPASPDFENQELVLTLEQLALTADEWAALNGPQDDVVRILSSDGSSVELVARYTGWVSMGAATPDGFALTLLDMASETIITSPDGLVWSEQQASQYEYSPLTVTADGTIWRAVAEPAGSLTFERSSYAETPATMARFEGLHPTGTLAAGPAGVAATAFPSLDGQLEASTIGGLPAWRDPDRISEPTGVALWLGFSADGTDWGWQSLPDALGITRGEPSAQLAVGRDFVIARVETYVGSTDSNTVPTPEDSFEQIGQDPDRPRWFVAKVP